MVVQHASFQFPSKVLNDTVAGLMHSDSAAPAVAVLPMNVGIRMSTTHHHPFHCLDRVMPTNIDVTASLFLPPHFFTLGNYSPSHSTFSAVPYTSQSLFTNLRSTDIDIHAPQLELLRCEMEMRNRRILYQNQLQQALAQERSNNVVQQLLRIKEARNQERCEFMARQTSTNVDSHISSQEIVQQDSHAVIKQKMEMKHAKPVSKPLSSFSPIRKAILVKKSKRPCKLLDRSKGNKNELKWLRLFDQLKEYKSKHGDCSVPRNYEPNLQLACWVAEQRKQYKFFLNGHPSSVTQHRIEMLESIDFAWKAQDYAWERRKDQLDRFYQEHGHFSVPLNHPKYYGLGNWIKQQRRLYRNGKEDSTRSEHNLLSQERVYALEQLGFDWNVDRKRRLRQGDKCCNDAVADTTERDVPNVR